MPSMKQRVKTTNWHPFREICWSLSGMSRLRENVGTGMYARRISGLTKWKQV